METNGGGGGAAPTGCYKCGRPGHWSRDCPSNPNSNPNNNTSSNKPAASSHPFRANTGGGGNFSGEKKPIEKPKKAPKRRPKLTPELLLSNDGLGFVLQHFPKAFKYRGRGREVKDLGNFLGLYAEWHNHLIPYYSFDQFVHKVEQVGSSKRVKLCMKSLRDRIANGGDPTKLHEILEPQENSNHEQDGMNSEEPNLDQENPLPNHAPDDFENDMLHDIIEKAAEEPSGPLNNDTSIADTSVQNESQTQTQRPDNDSIEMSEEVKARIEANRLKALERAAARKRALQSQAS